MSSPLRFINVENQVGSITVTAAAPGFAGTGSGIINVVTPAVSLLRNVYWGNPPTTTTSLSTNSPIHVSVGVPTADGTDLLAQSTGYFQAVRAGGTP